MNYDTAIQKQDIRQGIFNCDDGNEKSANQVWKEYSNAGGELTFNEWINQQKEFSNVGGETVVDKVKDAVEKNKGNALVYGIIIVGLGLVAYGIYTNYYKKD